MAMISLTYFYKVVEILETSPELKKTGRGIAKQMCCAAGGTAIGGMCGGPAGALIGGFAGAVYGYANSEDYSSLIQVLNDLTDEEKARMQQKVQELVGSVAIEDLIAFVQNEVNRQILLATVKTGVDAMRGG